MPIPVSAAFKAAEESDSNQIATAVQMVLGDYANKDSNASVASSTGDFSLDFPASGANDGDRTEINIGPASVADNGIGRSSWRSSGIPDNGDVVQITVDFGPFSAGGFGEGGFGEGGYGEGVGTLRTFNRTKLYHLNGQGLTSFQLEYWTGAAWVQYAKTPDIVGSGLNVSTTLQLDTIDHAAVTGLKVRLTVYHTQVAADFANVVAIEIYNLVDITDRVKSVQTNRARDYKLANNMASTVTLTCDNGDRFFSPAYTPTAAEVAAGFVNSELRPGLGLLVQQGFDYGGPRELVRTFTGTIDLFRPKSVPREADIDCRDAVKEILNRSVSAKLKTNIDVGDIITYVLNLVNISNYEMSIDKTSILEDHFFTFQQTVATTIQQLVQACGDAQFYFDENGMATFRQYLQNVPQQHTDTTQADFNAGTVLQNIDTGSNPGAFRTQWILIDDFFFVLAGFPGPAEDPWVVDTQANVTITVVLAGVDGASVTLANTNPTFQCALHRAPFTLTTQNPAYGTFRFKCQSVCSGGGSATIEFITFVNGFVQVGLDYPGYALAFTAASVLLTRRDVGGASTTLLTVAANDGLEHEWRITRSTSGVFNVYRDGVFMGTATDNTYTANERLTWGQSGAISDAATTTLKAVWWSNDLLPTAALPYDSPTYPKEPIFESQVIDQQASILTEGNVIVNVDVPATTSINIYTATSSDGLSFDPYVLAGTSTVGGTLTFAIGSAVKRYIKYKIELVIRNTGSGYAGSIFITDGHTPTVFDVTLTWFTTAGQNKYHASVDFFLRYDGSIQNIEEEFSDSLGGDTAIINDIAVTSNPLILAGTDADTRWQGTANTPAEAISAGNPLAVAPGTYTFSIAVSSGMDTSLMAGANPAAAVVVFAGGAAGSWSFSLIHPTTPVLKVIVTVGGTITDLRLVGKAFQNSSTPIQALASDAASIAKYNKRSQTISNSFIINQGIAALIAAKAIANYKDPIVYLPNMEIRPHFRMQLGDRVNVVDDNTGLAVDFNVVALGHVVAGTPSGAEARGSVTLIKIPQGS